MYLLFFPFVNQRQKDNSFLWCKTIMCEKWRALMEKSGNEFQPSHVVCLSGHSRGMSLHSYSQGGRLMFFGTNVPLSDTLSLPSASQHPPTRPPTSLHVATFYGCSELYLSPSDQSQACYHSSQLAQQCH